MTAKNPDDSGYEEGREGVGAPMELTPTASWWLKVGTNTFAKNISLGSTVIQTTPTPAFGWTANREHWAIAASITDLSVTLGTSDIVFSRNFASSGAPTPELIADASQVATPTLWRFQVKAKGALTAKDWSAGAPPMGQGLLRYYEPAGTPGNTSPRVLFELTADKKNFARISWLAKSPHNGHSAGFTLVQKSVPQSWTGYYYYSVATGL